MRDHMTLQLIGGDELLVTCRTVEYLMDLKVEAEIKNVTYSLT